MAYLKPPWFTRKVFNPLAMRFGMGGSVTVVVPGRRTGEPQKIPVIPVDLDGSRYLVSTRGESEWVRNLRAAGGGELRSKRSVENFRATEVPAAERSPILAAYRKLAGRTVETYFSKLPDPGDHPVFRIEPAER
jgi:deazaflavin-dependent oxidoreductase (nitroreductase family)